MSVFARYEMVTAKRERPSTVQHKRIKIVERINEQLLVIEADRQGKQFSTTRNKWVVGDDGARRVIKSPHYPKKWYWKRDGRYVCQLKYGNRVIQIANKHNSILVDNLKEVKDVYELFLKVADKGDFDINIATATASAKKK
jgi:hypothetical protein